MITLKEIAKKCSVSIATVSNILNNKSNVSEETKQRVLQVIKETGYKPNYMARGLRATKTNTIGLLIDDLTQFSASTLVDGIMSYLEEKNYKSILENLRFFSKYGNNWEDNEPYKNAVASAIQEFDAVKVDGIIYVASHCRAIDSIPSDISIPTTICYAFSKDKNIPSVMIDDKQAAYNLANHLIQNGHKEIAIILGSKDNIHTEKRLEGLKQALDENNISSSEQILYYGDWSFTSGYNSCKSLFESGKKFTAIFCFNDMMAAGAYKYLREIKLTPGKDISIVGFDNQFNEDLIEPKLTTMKLPLFQIGRKSAEVILNKINTPEENNENTELFIDCSFIEGQSVKKIN